MLEFVNLPMQTLFFEISLILLVATGVSVVARILRQPLIVGYILTGVLVGPRALGLMHSVHEIESLSKFGIAILLFIVGLGLSPKILKDVGKASLITGAGQVMFTVSLGFLLTRLLGYSTVSSLYVAIALAFSSTIIILKLLTERDDLEKLYGRISIGFLLVQDIIATIVLLVISTPSGQVLSVFAKGAGLMVLLSFVSSKILRRMSDFFAQSGELLFLFSLGWGLGVSVAFYYVGLSIEVGALLAGISLSLTPYSQEAAAKLKPLREFFLIIFFILLGSQLEITNLMELLPAAAALSAIVLVGNPLIVVTLMELLGYNKKASFMAGLTVAQISEFSLIVVLLGVSLGHIPENVLSLVTLIGLLTIAGSTYMILGADKIYPAVKGFIGFLEKKKPAQETDILSSYEVVLFGCSRVGYDFIEVFKNLGTGFLCVDYDPKVVNQLVAGGVNAKYGDAEDIEFLSDLNLKESQMVICTIPDFDAGMLLLEQVKQNPDVIVIMVSYSIENTLRLYEQGADYVIMPHFIGSRVMADVIAQVGFDTEHFNREKEKHLEYLEERKRLGHTHPGEPKKQPTFEV